MVEILERTMKNNYEHDPESYFEDKHDREEQDAQEKLTRWERENPNWPYGFKPND